MLQLIRDRAHGFIAWVVVIFISIPFALWGIQQYLGQDADISVAKVNGQEISRAEFQIAYQRQRANLQSLLGSGRDIDLLDESRIRTATLERLVEDEIIVQAGTRDGLRISDEQLARAIREQGTFQVAGAFSQDAYTDWLSRQGLSPGRFEYLLRRSMVSTQLESGIAGSAIATTREASRMRKLLDQRRVFVELVVSPGRSQEVEIGDEAIADYYEKNKPTFVSPEQVKVEYVVLSRDELAATVAATEEDLRELYDSYKANFVTAEQRKASHILVSVDDDRSEAAAREKIDELRRRLEAGESFADLARENSDDPGSAGGGGDLGFFGRGAMDPAFEEAAFALEKGELSQPVRSSFGFHLIRVEEIRAGETKSFDAVREDLLRDLRGEAADNLFVDQAEQLSRLTFENPDTLEFAAEALGLTVRKSDFFTDQGVAGDSILGDPAVVSAAFSDDVREGNNSAAIELESNRVVVLRMSERRDATQRSLEMVKEEIAARLRERASRQRVRKQGREILRRLRAGEDPEGVAAEAGVAWSEEITVARTTSEMDPGALRAVFRMKRPSADRATFDAAIAANGDFVVIQLRSVAAGSGADDETPSLQSTRLRVAQDSGRAQYASYLETLRDGADVEMRQDQL